MAGSAKDAAYRALQRLIREPGSPNDIWHDVIGAPYDKPQEVLEYVLSTQEPYGDREAVLVFASLLEHSLEIAISTHFVPDPKVSVFSYNDDGPLSTFAAKIPVGYALGIYDDKVRQDLTRIKNIRNAFAHARVQVDFKKSAIVQNCALLDVPLFWQAWKSPRDRFVIKTGLISQYLRSSATGKPLRFSKSSFYRTMFDGGGPPPSPRKRRKP